LALAGLNEQQFDGQARSTEKLFPARLFGIVQGDIRTVGIGGKRAEAAADDDWLKLK